VTELAILQAVVHIVRRELRTIPSNPEHTTHPIHIIDHPTSNSSTSHLSPSLSQTP
jgi:hypothetical protein